MTSYNLASTALLKQALNLRNKNHKPLAETDIDVVLVYAAVDKQGEPKGPALKASGYPVYSKSKIVPPKDQVKGVAALEITLDGDRWDKLDKKTQEAVLDHALQCFTVGDGDTEDGEPKLKERKPDHCFMWFDEIAARHGDASIEVQEAKRFLHEKAPIYLQIDLPFPDADDANGKDDNPPSLAGKGVKELRLLAKERGVEVPNRASKELLIGALEASTN